MASILDQLVGCVEQGPETAPKTAYLVVGAPAKDSAALTAMAKELKDRPPAVILFIETEEEPSP